MDNTLVGITIGLKTAGFGALSGNITKLNQLSASLANAGKNVANLNSKIAKISTFKANIDTNVGKISGELSNWQSRLATAASFAVPVKLAIDFESSMADVKKYVEFSSDEQVKQLGNEIKNLSNELGVSANELAQIAASGGQLGLKSDEIAGFTKLVSKMGVAFDMSGKDAGNAIALTMNNLKLGIDEIATLGDKINYLDDKMSMVNARDIINVIGRTAGSGSILGLKGDKISALASSFLSLGKAPEVASTAMNSLFNKLANIDGQDEKFKEALKSMGMDAKYLQIALKKDASGGLDLFLDRLSKVDKASQMGVLSDLFGAQFADDFGSLVNAIDQYKKANELIKDSGANGSMDSALKAKLATTKSALERLSQVWLNLGATIGEAFLPTLNLLTSGLTKVGEWLNALTQTSPKLSNALFGVAGGVLALVTLAPAVKILAWTLNIAWQQVKILGTGIGILTELFKLKYLSTLKLNAAYLANIAITKSPAAITLIASSVSRAYAATITTIKSAALLGAAAIRVMKFALISTGIGALVVALGMAAAYLIENWDKVKTFFSVIWDRVKGYWQDTANFLSNIWQVVSQKWHEFGLWASEFFTPILQTWEVVKGYFSQFLNWLGGVFEPVINLWSNAFGGFFDWIGAKFGWIGESINAVLGGLSGAWDFAKGLFGSSDISVKQTLDTKTQSWQSDGFFSSLSSKGQAPQHLPKAALSSGGAVNVSFNGDFHLFSNNGKFDLEQFKAQIAQGVKDALRRDAQNAANRDIRGQ